MNTIQIASPIEAATETVRAGSWTLLMARLFGRRVEASNTRYHIVMARWRGRWYVIETRRAA